jgi:V8-like Glu-specific endopeptidase
MEMSLEEAAEFLNPITEIGHYTYRPTKEDALEFARNVREAISKRLTMEAPGEEAMAGFDEREEREIIPGFGSWSLINSSAANSPYARIATMDQGAGRCTAEKLINHHTAVTAAHCVQDSSENWMSRQRIRFAAGSANTANGGTGDAEDYLPSGCYARTVPGCWNGVGGTCDYAVLTLRGGAFNAWCDYSDYNVGYFGYTTVNNEYTGMTVRTSGYPGTPPSGSYPGLSYHRRTDGETNNNAWLYYHNDTDGGQSGGAVFNDGNRMRATHVGYLGGDWNVGMRLTTTVIDFFKDYQGD